MSHWHKSVALACLITAACCMSGCTPAKRDTAQVEGTVTHNGKPVEKQQVVFTSRTAGSSGSAVLQDGGKFQVVGFLAPGSYVVTIQPPPSSPMDPPVKLDKSQLAPEKYRDEKTSDLKVDVVAGKNQFSLELK